MKKTIYFCDRCGKEIKGDPNRIYIGSYDGESGDSTFDLYEPDFDLCLECAKTLVKCTSDFIKPVAVEEEKQEKPKKRKPIDKGKVKALHDAGWSAAKIADEMGCSSANIYLILKEGKA